MPKLKPAEVTRLLKQATDDFAALLAQEELAKADPGEETPAEKTPPGSATASPPDASAPDASAPDASAPPMADAGGPPQDASPEASAPGAAPEGSPDAAGDPAADAQASPEALKAEYASLPIEELKLHVMASHAALMDAMGGQSPDGSAEGSAPPAPEASAPPAPPAPEASPEMGKKEFSSDASGGKVTEGKMSKSQMDDVMVRLEKAEQAVAEVADLKKSLADRDAVIAGFDTQIGKVAAGITKLMSRPMRKSVTGVSFVQKPDGTAPAGQTDISALSKSQVQERLNAASKNPALSKEDRSAIISFTVGKAPIESVAKFLAQ